MKLSQFSQGFQTRDRVMQFYSNSVSAFLKRVTGCSQEESNALGQHVVIAWNKEGSLKYFLGLRKFHSVFV